MTIHFKNGQTVEVSKFVCNAIANTATPGGLISFKDSKDGIYLVVNISEIVYIEESPIRFPLGVKTTGANKPE